MIGRFCNLLLSLLDLFLNELRLFLTYLPTDKLKAI